MLEFDTRRYTHLGRVGRIGTVHQTHSENFFFVWCAFAFAEAAGEFTTGACAFTVITL